MSTTKRINTAISTLESCLNFKFSGVDQGTIPNPVSPLVIEVISLFYLVQGRRQFLSTEVFWGEVFWGEVFWGEVFWGS